MHQESPILRGVTFDQFEASDNTHLFRKQYNRTLSQIDELLLNQERLRKAIGAERASQISANPDLFYNHEKFRIMQAQGRFRAIVSTAVFVPILSVAFSRRQNGIAWLKNTPGKGLLVVGGVFLTTFALWHRKAGYGAQIQNEQSFAKNEKMLRNIIIKA